MNENEMLARWLGWRLIDPDLSPQVWNTGPVNAFNPKFRTSNEWAGALLDKLMKDGYGVQLCSGMKGRTSIQLLAVSLTGSLSDWTRNDWREAVVDAVLEAIRRES